MMPKVAHPAQRRGGAHDAERPERSRGPAAAQHPLTWRIDGSNASPFVPGAGLVELAHVSGATAVVGRVATSPLKLLTPRGHAGCAHVVSSTYGGGLLAGDRIALRVVAGPDTRCVLGTQASTKVYRSTDRRTSAQSLDATIGVAAVLAVAPDPVTCFAGARYEQRQHFELEAGASLLLIDWLTSGRAARGERWAFDYYRNETRIDVGGGCVARESMLLDPIHGPIGGPYRMGRFDCMASVYLLGPAFADAAAGLVAAVGAMPVRKRDATLAAASPLNGGAVLRVAGGAAESVGRFITRQLAPAWTAVGDDPFSPKW
jgi:urease accessory protein